MTRRHKLGPADERYVTIPVRTWETLRLRGVEPRPDAAALYVYLWSGPYSARVPGVTPSGRAALAEALNWESEQFADAFATLEAADLAIADWKARLVYLPESLTQVCSRPASPSTAAMWRREVIALPCCALKDRIDDDVRKLLATMGPAFLASYSDGRRTESKAQGAGSPAGSPPDSGQAVGLGGGHPSLSLSLSLAPSPAPAPEQSAAHAAAPPSAPPPGGERDQAGDGVGSDETQKKPAKKAGKKPTAEPLPYTVDELQAALAETCKRYTATPLQAGPTINAQKLIRAHSLEDVRLIGAWLEAGGDGYKLTLDGRNLGDLPVWLAHARGWDANGRPAISRAANGKAAGAHHGWAPPAPHNDVTKVVKDF